MYLASQWSVKKRKENQRVKLLICAGGTGGGVYPALAVLQALMELVSPTNSNTSEDLDVLWVGGSDGMEVDLVNRSGIAYEGIPAAGVHGVGLRALPGNLIQLSKGYGQSRRILSDFQPDVLFFTGGYVAVPMALAGRKTPACVFVPDIEPGLAIKTISRFADHITVPVEDSEMFFSGRADVTVTGYPTRSQMLDWEKETALQEFNFSTTGLSLLVFGGSKGARSINRALLPVLPELLEEVQIIHVTGSLDWQEVEDSYQDLSEEQQMRYRIYPYLHEKMGAALRAADLVLSRAGASSLGEFPLFGLPAILVPYPHAWRYQRVNAQYLVERGAAIQIEDSELPYQILPQVLDLVRDTDRLQAMQRSMTALAKPEAAASIAHILLNLASSRSRKGNNL